MRGRQSFTFSQYPFYDTWINLNGWICCLHWWTDDTLIPLSFSLQLIPFLTLLVQTMCPCVLCPWDQRCGPHRDYWKLNWKLSAVWFGNLWGTGHVRQGSPLSHQWYLTQASCLINRVICSFDTGSFSLSSWLAAKCLQVYYSKGNVSSGEEWLLGGHALCRKASCAPDLHVKDTSDPGVLKRWHAGAAHIAYCILQ